MYICALDQTAMYFCGPDRRVLPRTGPDRHVLLRTRPLCTSAHWIRPPCTSTDQTAVYFCALDQTAMYRCAPDKNVTHHCAVSTVAVRFCALDQTTRLTPPSPCAAAESMLLTYALSSVTAVALTVQRRYGDHLGRLALPPAPAALAVRRHRWPSPLRWHTAPAATAAYHVRQASTSCHRQPPPLPCNAVGNHFGRRALPSASAALAVPRHRRPSPLRDGVQHR
jgi:hypothetical protein